MRECFFTPRLKFKTYDELNAWLTDKIIAYAKMHPHPERPERTIWEMFEEERPRLVAYRGRFDGFHALPASVSKTCLVRFDNNKYSVNAAAIGRPVEIFAYADRVVIRQEGRVVAEHARCYGRGETIYDPWHYVPILARKPGALRNGAPFKDWVLPAALERVRRKLAGSNDGDRQMVKVLAAVLADGLPAVEAACAEALAEGVHSADVILNHFGGPSEVVRLPSWLLRLGATAGDLAAYLGWAPPIRSTALEEMRRGVIGDPTAWIVATRTEPMSLQGSLSQLAPTVQERWFARLYLMKAAIFSVLALFWIASGLIALLAAFKAATAILMEHGFSSGLAQAITIVSSLVDIGIGVAIAMKRTCRIGLLVGIAVSLFYMITAALITPDLWIEPLGALVKTGPAIVLMLIALMIRENR